MTSFMCAFAFQPSMRSALAALPLPSEMSLGRNRASEMIGVIAPVQVEYRKGLLDEFLEAMTHACCDNEVMCGFALEHPPHCIHVLGRPPPVTPDLNVSERELLVAALRYAAGSRDDLARYKTLRSDRRFVIEENACCGVQSVRFAIVGNQPIRGGLGDRIGTAGPKWSVFHGATGISVAIALAGASIVKAGGLA